MKRAQAGILGLVIFMVIAGGFCLYLLYPFLEPVRLDAIENPTNQTQPLLMLVLYGLQPILWGGWLLTSLAAIIGASRVG